MNKQLADDLRRLADAVEGLPESLPDDSLQDGVRYRVKLWAHGANQVGTLQQLAALMRDAHPEENEGCFWLSGAFGDGVSITAFSTSEAVEAVVGKVAAA